LQKEEIFKIICFFNPLIRYL